MTEKHVACRTLQYERKLATLTAMNSVLQSENESLRDSRSNGASDQAQDIEDEMADLQDEFARRLGQADKNITDLKV